MRNSDGLPKRLRLCVWNLCAVGHGQQLCGVCIDLCNHGCVVIPKMGTSALSCFLPSLAVGLAHLDSQLKLETARFHHQIRWPRFVVYSPQLSTDNYRYIETLRDI